MYLFWHTLGKKQTEVLIVLDNSATARRLNVATPRDRPIHIPAHTWSLPYQVKALNIFSCYCAFEYCVFVVFIYSLNIQFELPVVYHMFHMCIFMFSLSQSYHAQLFCVVITGPTWVGCPVNSWSPTLMSCKSDLSHLYFYLMLGDSFMHRDNLIEFHKIRFHLL